MDTCHTQQALPRPSYKKELWKEAASREDTKEMGGQHPGMDGPKPGRVAEGSGRHRKLEESGVQVLAGVPTTSLEVKDRT